MDTANQRMTEFLSSLSLELSARADAVRQLIGAKHWLTDGHHKEQILQGVIERHCPSSVRVGKGFVINPGSPDSCSKEQDIILFDSRAEAPFLETGDLVVVSAQSTIACVSVKSSLGTSELRSSIEGLNSVRKVLATTPKGSSGIWCGAFFFKGPERQKPKDWINKHIKRELSKSAASLSSDFTRDVNPLGPNMFVSLQKGLLISTKPGNRNGGKHIGDRAVVYECGQLGAAVFLARLIGFLSNYLGQAAAGLLSPQTGWNTKEYAKSISKPFQIPIGRRTQ